jgi:hypothetical protein
MSRVWQVGICGTFDVANYGDLLFPIIAEAELSRRLGAINLYRFSYHGKDASEWPYEVTSVSELPDIAEQLDAILIGGGFIVRFDKLVATGYYPPNDIIHHPTGYWLSPALIALQHGVPVIWNAPGMHCNEVPDWARPLLKLALEQSPHIKVRDALSQASLSSVTNLAQVDVLPDTAFGLPQLIDPQSPSERYLQVRDSMGLDKPYLVLHTIRGLDSFLHLWRSHAEQFGDLQLLLLPIGPVLGDHESVLGYDLSRAKGLPFWPDPLLLAELIAHSEGVVGHSYHLAISALAFGVPVFCSADLSQGKYTALPAYERVFQLQRDDTIDPLWFRSQLGKQSVSVETTYAQQQVSEHWDRVAEIISAGRRPTSSVLNRFWQALPGLLEDQQTQTESLAAEWQREREQKKKELDWLEQLLMEREQAHKNLETENHHLRPLQHRLNELRQFLSALELQHAQLLMEDQAKTMQINQLLAEQVLNADHLKQLRLVTESANGRLEELHNSHSFRLTAPLRHIRRVLTKLLGKQ